MTRFEDNLWRELAGTYGPQLSDADGPLHPRSRLRAPLVAGTSLGVIGAGVAAVIVLTAGSAAPAFAVTSHQDGTVSVVIRRIDGIPGANRRLEQLGIRARAVQVATGCWARAVRPAEGVPVMTLATGRHKNWVTATPGSIHARIRPATIPRGRTLVLPAVRAGAVVRLVHARVVSGAIPGCLPPAVRVRAAATSGKVQIVSCRGGTTVPPAPLTTGTATNTTAATTAAPPKTITEFIPPPSPATNATTDTNANTETNETSTDPGATTPASGTATNPTQVLVPGHPGSPNAKLPLPPALIRACQFASRAAAK